MRILLLVAGIILLCTIVYSVCVQQEFSSEKPNDIIENQTPSGGVLKLDSQKESTHLTKIDDGEDAYRVRSGWFSWNNVESKKSEINWDSSDQLRVRYSAPVYENKSTASRCFVYGNQSTVFILDPEEEHIEVVPGACFYIERTVDGLHGTDVIFVSLFSDALMPKKIELVDNKYDSGDEVPAFEIFENDGLSALHVYSAGRPASRLEKIIDKHREKLPSDLKQLDKVAYSQPFRLQSPCTVRIWFQAPSWEEITCGCKPSSGQISYLVFSSDGFDFEGSTWWSSDWSCRKLITINSSQVNATLTNFPILVYRASDGDLASYAQNDGDDITFVLYSDNTTQLNHEIELFNYTTGELVAWVNVTSLSSSVDTKIWMYYGNSPCSSQENSGGVWDSDYMGVWHLDTNCTDSTNNNYNGTATGSPSNVSGKIGNAKNFNQGNPDHYVTGSITHNIGTGNFTFEAWVNRDIDTGQPYQGIMANGAYSPAMYVEVDGSSRWGGYWSGDMASDHATTTGIWYYYVTKRSGSTIIFYRNGSVEPTTYTRATSMANAPLIIGSSSDIAANHMDGTIDEVRFSNIERNESWINTSYNTMNSPSTFLHFGNQENSCSIPNNSDWNISTYCTLEDTTEIMAQDKDINILSGGRLDIVNSTLTMNLTADGNSNIYVYNGGTLFINDSTLNTTISTNNPKIIAYSGSNLEVRNSVFNYWGYDAGSPEGAIDIYTDNVTIDSNNFSNCYQAVYGYNVDNITINNNRIIDFTKDALDFNGINNSEITNNFVSNSGTDDAFNLYNVLNTVVSGNTINGTIDDGLSIDGAVNLTLSNNQYSNVSDRVINIDDYEQACSEITLTNETISSSPVGVSLGYGSNSFGNVTVVDCNITTTTGDAFELFGTNGNNVTVYNTQFNKSRVSVGAGWIALIVKWSFNVYVNNSNGQPIEGAAVNVTDVFNNQVASKLTNSTGWIQQQNITEFSENSSSRTYYTNYTINVSKSGHAPSSQSENISDSTTLYVTLAEANNVPTIDLINPSPNGTTDINIQPTCQIWANDTDGDTLNVTWATNESGSWVNKHTNTSITANSTVSYQFTDFDTSSKTYYWMAYADDGMENVSRWFYFATEAIDTSVDTISPYQVTSSAVRTPLSLYLESPNFVYEGEEFTIIVRNSLSTGNMMEGVLVVFNDISKLTNVEGKVVFEAPQVVSDTVYSIKASKNGYLGDEIGIVVIKIPVLPKLNIIFLNKIEGDTFEVIIADFTGKSMIGVRMIFNGKEYISGSQGIAILDTPEKAGDYEITVEKEGFTTSSVTVVIPEKAEFPWLIMLTVVILILLIFIVSVTYVLKKTKKI